MSKTKSLITILIVKIMSQLKLDHHEEFSSTRQLFRPVVKLFSRNLERNHRVCCFQVFHNSLTLINSYIQLFKLLEYSQRKTLILILINRDVKK